MATTSTWIIGPAGRCVSYVTEEVKVASVLYHAVLVFGGLESLLEAARRELKRAGRSDIPIDRFIAANKTLGLWARELVADDYQAITVHSLIGLWATVEVAVEDTATLILMNDPDAVGHVKAAGIKISRPLPPPLNDADARWVYKRLERPRDGEEKGKIAESYCRNLSILGVTVTITSETATTMSELNYVRNCFLHRGGVVDERVALEAPNLHTPVGEKIRVSENQAKHYLKGVGDFASALLKGALESRHSPTGAR